MKKALVLILLAISLNGYMIGGAYASLISCAYGQYGYQYGNIGTYNVNGQHYRIFFGSRYCEY